MKHESKLLQLLRWTGSVLLARQTNDYIGKGGTEMKNTKGDLLWGFILLIWILVLVIPAARTVFIGATEAHPYLGGFVKFAISGNNGRPSGRPDPE